MRVAYHQPPPHNPLVIPENFLFASRKKIYPESDLFLFPLCFSLSAEQHPSYRMNLGRFLQASLNLCLSHKFCPDAPSLAEYAPSSHSKSSTLNSPDLCVIRHFSRRGEIARKKTGKTPPKTTKIAENKTCSTTTNAAQHKNHYKKPPSFRTKSEGIAEDEDAESDLFLFPHVFTIPICFISL